VVSRALFGSRESLRPFSFYSKTMDSEEISQTRFSVAERVFFFFFPSSSPGPDCKRRRGFLGGKPCFFMKLLPSPSKIISTFSLVPCPIAPDTEGRTFFYICFLLRSCFLSRCCGVPPLFCLAIHFSLLFPFMAGTFEKVFRQQNFPQTLIFFPLPLFSEAFPSPFFLSTCCGQQVPRRR